MTHEERAHIERLLAIHRASLRELEVQTATFGYHLVTIDGIGGIGKSALALELASWRTGLAHAESGPAIPWDGPATPGKEDQLRPSSFILHPCVSESLCP